MAERKIFCVCGKYLGVIRDAKLLKGIVFLCPNCEVKRKASDLHEKTQKKSPFEDLFKGRSR